VFEISHIWDKQRQIIDEIEVIGGLYVNFNITTKTEDLGNSNKVLKTWLNKGSLQLKCQIESAEYAD